MKLKVYTIFDSAASAYINPFYMQNDGLAIRAFQDNVNAKEENNISKHPEQFSLHRIGEYCDQTAVIQMDEKPRCIARGHELINDTVPQYSNVDLDSIGKSIDSIVSKMSKLSDEIQAICQHPVFADGGDK